MKTSTERQAAFEQRQRALGRVQRKIWIHVEDWATIRDFVMKMNRKREQNTTR